MYSMSKFSFHEPLHLGFCIAPHLSDIYKMHSMLSHPPCMGIVKLHISHIGNPLPCGQVRANKILWAQDYPLEFERRTTENSKRCFSDSSFGYMQHKRP